MNIVPNKMLLNHRHKDCFRLLHTMHSWYKMSHSLKTIRHESLSLSLGLFETIATVAVLIASPNKAKAEKNDNFFILNYPRINTKFPYIDPVF